MDGVEKNLVRQSEPSKLTFVGELRGGSQFYAKMVSADMIAISRRSIKIGSGVKTPLIQICAQMWTFTVLQNNEVITNPTYTLLFHIS